MFFPSVHLQIKGSKNGKNIMNRAWKTPFRNGEQRQLQAGLRVLVCFFSFTPCETADTDAQCHLRSSLPFSLKTL